MDLRALEPFAMEHHGVVTRDACIRAGISSASWYRAHRDGMLEPLHRNVARMVGTPRTRQQAVCAAVLAAGRGALASHRSAAFLWGIPRPDVDPVDVLLPDRARRASLSPVVVHRPSDLGDLNPVRRQGIPVTNVLRTLCDLGAVDARSVNAAVGHVVTTGLASPASLRQALERHARRGRAGVVALRDALDDWVIDGKPVDSVLEPAMHRLLRRHRLPPAEFHAVICGYEVDFWLIGTPVVLECDGWTWHGRQRSVFERDKVRDAELAASGYIVVRFTFRQIMRHPGREAERIRQVVHRWSPTVLGAVHVNR